MTRAGLYQVLLLVAILIVAWTYLFPALNWPDEVYKLEQLPYDTHIYARLLSFLGPGECNVQTQAVGGVSYLSNTLRVSATGPLGCYYAFKTINAVLFFALVLIGYGLLKNQTAQTSFLLAMIWPSLVFYSSSINQQTVFSVVSAFLVTTTLTSKKVWPALVVSVPLILVDRSFVALVVYLGILVLLKWRPRAVVPMFLVVIAAVLVLRPYILNYSSAYLMMSPTTSIGDLSETVARFQDPIYVSVALFFISFVYLGGTNTLFGIGIDYLVVFIFFCIAFKRKLRNQDFASHFFSFTVTYFFIVSIIPTLQTFRYYVFIMPAIAYFFVDTVARRRLYIRYSFTMSAIYLFMINATSI